MCSNRLSYSSPKLLASINNINISSSPLGVISSAGYKNGNYFKFPEIDHVVQEQKIKAETQLMEEVEVPYDNQSHNKQKCVINNLWTIATKSRSKTLVCDSESSKDLSGNVLDWKPREQELGIEEIQFDKSNEEIPCRIEGRRNRKNKNNLTIKITDAGPVEPIQVSPSISSPTSPKSKTPTIKNTKEKALSLDSAPVESEADIIISNRNDAHESCGSMNAKTLTLNACQLKQINEYNGKKCSNRSTSLSQLSSFLDANNVNTGASSMMCKPHSNTQRFVNVQWRTPRRRIPILSNKDLAFQRKQNSSIYSNFDSSNNIESVDLCEKHLRTELMDEWADDTQCEGNGEIGSTHTPSPSQNLRGVTHKYNSLIHSSNTNLKTLPELLTLVEFSPSRDVLSSNIEHKSKHKSDMTSSTLPLPVSQPYRIANQTTTPSTNLLQRRGSNQSLTLNLHGSCSNLLGSGRSYPSVSNYSLGSVDNSTSNLNSKSSCNLDLATMNTPRIINAIPSNVTNTQATKQILFRRRGSNHSLTLNNVTTTSCGNLNAFASQNSLNIDQRPHIASSVTRTTSFTKRGLLERRGSNQSLTLYMGGSLGGVGSERGYFDRSTLFINNACAEESDVQEIELAPVCCSRAIHRRYYSCGSLDKFNERFLDMNQLNSAMRNQLCFRSANNLYCREYTRAQVCICRGVYHTISEEFECFLANILSLQKFNKILDQTNLIKLNYNFDSGCTSNSDKITEHSLAVLSIHNSTEMEPPPAILATSEDYEVDERFQNVVHDVLESFTQNEEFSNLHKEYWDIPTNMQKKPLVFGSQTKNRYTTVLPNENSRFILKREWKQIAHIIAKKNGYDDSRELSQLILKKYMDKFEEVPYINASYIKGPDFKSMCYIATQGPLLNTIYDFWLMIYQNSQKYFSLIDWKKQQEQYYQKIVMLTNFTEHNRQKCSKYFPLELNEVFVIAGKEPMAQREYRPMHPSEKMTKFFHKYLQDIYHENDDIQLCEISKPFIGVEMEKADVMDDLFQGMPSLAGNSFFLIKNIGIVKKKGFSIRKLVVLYCTNLPRTQKSSSNEILIQKFFCYHYWYPDWPDHCSPRDLNTLLDICLHVMNLGKCESEFDVHSEKGEILRLQKYMEMQKFNTYTQDIYNTVQPLPVIHCSAGIGRTGCFIAILNAIRQLRQSFAYSLTAMASKASSSATQTIKPADFYLPASFLNETKTNNIVLNYDTDSSFTYTTLLYIKFILQQNNKEVEKLSSGENPEKIENLSTWQLPSLSDLPHMPEICIDILKIVANLRMQRGGMVQNSEQYELIHRGICLYFKRIFAIKRF